MKNYREMSNNVFFRVAQDKKKKHRKESRLTRVRDIVCICGIVCLAGFGSILSGSLNGIKDSSETEINNVSSEIIENENLLENLNIIKNAVWAVDLLDGERLDVLPDYREYKKGFMCEESLYNLLNSNPNKVYAIGIALNQKMSEEGLEKYVCPNGETYAEFVARERVLKEEYLKLYKLNMEGKILEQYVFSKDKESSAEKNMKEDVRKSIIDEIGESIISKYYVNGEFLQEQLREDIEKNINERKWREDEKRLIKEIYYEKCLREIESQMLENNIPVLVYKNPINENYCCAIFVTAEELGQIELKNPHDYNIFHALKPNDLECYVKMQEE